jgi:hypothetical protein
VNDFLAFRLSKRNNGVFEVGQYKVVSRRRKPAWALISGGGRCRVPMLGILPVDPTFRSGAVDLWGHHSEPLEYRRCHHGLGNFLRGDYGQSVTTRPTHLNHALTGVRLYSSTRSPATTCSMTLSRPVEERSLRALLLGFSAKRRGG